MRVTCTKRPKGLSKPAFRPVSIVFPGEDFILWWQWLSELRGFSIVLKSHSLDRSQAPGEAGPRLHFTASDIGVVSSFYLAGAVIGALGFGWMTYRLGRRPLFFITLRHGRHGLRLESGTLFVCSGC
jgi:MFS family permease